MLWKIVITWVNFKHCVDGRKRENRSHARHGLVCSGSNTYKRHTLFDYVQFPLEPGRRQYLPSKRKKSIFPEKVVKSQWFCIIFREVVVIWRIILIVKIAQFLSKKKFVNLRRASPIVLENVVIWRIILTLKVVNFLSIFQIFNNEVNFTLNLLPAPFGWACRRKTRSGGRNGKPIWRHSVWKSLKNLILNSICKLQSLMYSNFRAFCFWFWFAKVHQFYQKMRLLVWFSNAVWRLT